MKQQQHHYGRVLYDFVAERSDELDCKADEAIIVIAQSNKEWYVAKPIGRLGGPGLIPVSFVQLHDVITNHPISTKSHHHTPSMVTSVTPVSIPNLDEWKQQTQIYEASSIPLTHDDPQSPLPSSSSMSKCSSDQHNRRYSSALNQLTHPSSPHHHHHPPKSASTPFSNPRRNSEFVVIKNRSSHSTPKQQQSSVTMDTSMVVEITVNSFIMEGDEYWFVLYATVSNGKHRILYRTYDRK
jgi:bud emergence protein 1